MVALLAIVDLPAHGQAIRQDLDGPYGPVHALAQSGDTLYLGGDFDHVGPPTSNVVRLSPETGRLLEDLNLRGTVRHAIPDGEGGWLVAGFFTGPGRAYPRTIAHVRTDGTLGPLDPESNGDVDVLLKHGSTLFFGGNFYTMDGQPRARVAAYDLDADTLLAWDAAIARNTSSYVKTLEVANGMLYIGGAFNTVGGQTRMHAAAVDLETAEISPWNPDLNLFVEDLSVGPDAVYLAGSFTTVSGQPRPYLAAVDPFSGAPREWNPAPSYVCHAVQHSGTSVFVGGRFPSIGGLARAGFAALDAATGTVREWSPTLAAAENDPVVTTLALIDDQVYFGGLFVLAGGARRLNLAAVDTTVGAVASWYPGATNWVTTLAADGNAILAGGYFDRIGGTPRSRLASIHVGTGRVTAWDPDANGTVRALAASEGTVYAGGSFSRIGGLQRRALAAIDATGGFLRPDWTPSADGTVRALALAGTTLYAGGSFTHVDDHPRSRIAALDVATGAVTTWQPDADSTVRAVVTGGGRVYVGGDFGHIGGAEHARVAAIDSATGAAVAWNAHPMADGANVNALALQNGRLYAGGTFTAIGGQPRERLAALDLDTGDALAWNPGRDKTVYALAPSAGGGHVYVGSADDFEPVAAIHATTGAITSWRPANRSTTFALAADATWIHAGGEAGLFGIPAPGVTSTLLALFHAESRADGIAIRWQLGFEAAGLAFRLERSTAPSGPWSACDAAIERDGEQIVALDRAVERGVTYHYRLVLDLPSGAATFGPVAATFGGAVPAFALTRVAPSPTTGPATIEFVVARSAPVRLEVLDLQGRIVARLVDETLRAGTWQATWNGRRAGARAPAGVYFVRFSAGDVRATRKLVVSR